MLAVTEGKSSLKDNRSELHAQHELTGRGKLRFLLTFKTEKNLTRNLSLIQVLPQVSTPEACKRKQKKSSRERKGWCQKCVDMALLQGTV